MPAVALETVGPLTGGSLGFACGKGSNVIEAKKLPDLAWFLVKGMRNKLSKRGKRITNKKYSFVVVVYLNYFINPPVL